LALFTDDEGGDTVAGFGDINSKGVLVGDSECDGDVGDPADPGGNFKLWPTKTAPKFATD
jgi:hypothetical protein